MIIPEAKAMVDQQIARRGIRDANVLNAMGKIDRELFVPTEEKRRAFSDHALPIGHGQTISQPYIVAAMTDALQLKATDRVLEIGTGSGYQTAVLAEIACEIWTIEIVQSLGQKASDLLEGLGYTNLHCRIGDGGGGWPDKAPFDKIIVTAAPKQIPDTLLAQLTSEGLLVIPVGSNNQELLRLRQTSTGVAKERLFAVRFVSMTGLASS
jgi:protein-L-isoaspartate(D-aspartate) O-methyltransferase